VWSTRERAMEAGKSERAKELWRIVRRHYVGEVSAMAAVVFAALKEVRCGADGFEPVCRRALRRQRAPALLLRVPRAGSVHNIVTRCCSCAVHCRQKRRQAMDAVRSGLVQLDSPAATTSPIRQGDLGMYTMVRSHLALLQSPVLFRRRWCWYTAAAVAGSRYAASSAPDRWRSVGVPLAVERCADALCAAACGHGCPGDVGRSESMLRCVKQHCCSCVSCRMRSRPEAS
jgi:hypothetical protein